MNHTTRIDEYEIPYEGEPRVVMKLPKEHRILDAHWQLDRLYLTVMFDACCPVAWLEETVFYIYPCGNIPPLPDEEVLRKDAVLPMVTGFNQLVYKATARRLGGTQALHVFRLEKV